MKGWTVSDDISRDAELARLVGATRPVVEREIGPSAAAVEARWELAPTPGRREVVLTLSDWTWPAGVRTSFAPGELAAPARVGRKVHWLWGDLLQERNHQQLRQLLADVA